MPQDPAPDTVNDFFSFFGETSQFYSLPNKAETGYYGTFKQNEPGLRRDNQAGKDIYFTVNECKKGIRRKKSDYVRTRAVWLDDDGASKGGETDPDSFPIKPNIIVNTSPGKHHYYWLCNFKGIELSEGINRRICTEHNGDPNTLDITRVLRVPGFVHNKSGMVVTYEVLHSHIYTEEELIEAFPPIMAEVKEHTIDETREKFSVKEAIESILTGENVHGARVSLAMHWANSGMPKADALATLNGYVEDSMRTGNIDAGRAMERLANMKQAVESAYSKVEAEHTVPKYQPESSKTLFTQLDMPPGAMGQVVEDILNTMMYPSKEMAIAVAFHCVSVFGGGIYHLDGKTVARKRTVLAHTGMGKSICNRYFSELVRQMAMKKDMFNPYAFIGSAHYAANNIHLELAEHRIRSYIVSEAGLMGKSKAGTTQETRAYMLKIIAGDYSEGFDGKMLSVRSAENRKMNEAMKTVYSVIPVLLSESVPDQYTDILKSDDSFRSGDVGREEIFFINDQRPKPRKPSRTLSPDVVTMMFNLAREFEATHSERGDDPSNPDQFIEVDYSEVEDEMFELSIQFNEDYNASTSSQNYVDIAISSRMYERIRTTVLALAIADAAYKNKKINLPKVTKEHLEYAVQYHKSLTESLRSQASGGGALSDPLEQCVQRVVDRAMSFGDLFKDKREAHDYANRIVRKGWVTDCLDRSKFKPYDTLINGMFRGNRRAALNEIISMLEDKRVLIPITNINTKVPLWKINT